LRIIKQRNPVNQEHKVNILILAIASGLFTGFVPIAPGTVASFLAMLIYLIPGVSHLWILAVLVVVFFIFGVITSNVMQKRYGFDPPEITIDEITGTLFTYFIATIVLEVFIRFKTFDPDFILLSKLTFGFTGFFLFRFFDITKLQPGKYFEEKNDSLGVMLDDVVAGFYAGILTAAVSHLVYYEIVMKILGLK
jgi:phosphatidylglycerophosphatase A